MYPITHLVKEALQSDTGRKKCTTLETKTIKTLKHLSAEKSYRKKCRCAVVVACVSLREPLATSSLMHLGSSDALEHR